MTSDEDTHAHWKAVNVEPADEYPEKIGEDDGPFMWENENTERRIWLEPADNLDEFDAWIVTGENSVVTSENTFKKAKEAAREFMDKYTHPSNMI